MDAVLADEEADVLESLFDAFVAANLAWQGPFEGGGVSFRVILQCTAASEPIAWERLTAAGYAQQVE